MNAWEADDPELRINKIAETRSTPPTWTTHRAFTAVSAIFPRLLSSDSQIRFAGLRLGFGFLIIIH